jgi:hypothetical protein
VSAASAQEDRLREVYHEMGSDSSEPDYDPPESEASLGSSLDIYTLFSDL